VKCQLEECCKRSSTVRSMPDFSALLFMTVQFVVHGALKPSNIRMFIHASIITLICTISQQTV